MIVAGLVSVAAGWHFLPNPILLKGHITEATPLGDKTAWCLRAVWAWVSDPVILVMLAVAVPTFILLHRHGARQRPGGKRFSTRISPMTGLVLVAAIGGLLTVDVLRSSKIARLNYIHEIYLVPAGLLAAGLVLFFLYRKDGLRLTANKAKLWIFLGTAVMHLALASRGWFYRYEAYLVATGMLVVMAVVYEEFLRGTAPATCRRYAAWWLAAGLCAVPFGVRSVYALSGIPRASMNIHQQQFQTASFLNRYYTDRGVAAIDIGAINYYADIRCLDLWGLSNLPVADARLEGHVGPEEVHALCRDNSIDVAVVFDKWCDDEFGGVPPQWERVARWEIVDNLVCGWYVVSFYAVNPSETRALEENLAEFSPELPEQVIQHVR